MSEGGEAASRGHLSVQVARGPRRTEHHPEGIAGSMNHRDHPGFSFVLKTGDTLDLAMSVQ